MPCPQTEEEILAFFWDTIGKHPGQDANDFEAVLAAAYMWNGVPTIFPRDVPTQGNQLPSDSPFYGITIQAGADGIPAGRIWIPAAQPDGNNYYTRYFQVIKDKPGGVHRKDFEWDLRYLAGNAYVPICDGSEPGPTPPSDCCERLQQELDILKGIVADNTKRIKLLEEQNSVEFPKRVALRSLANGKWLAAEINSTLNVRARSEAIGPWEQYELKILE